MLLRKKKLNYLTITFPYHCAHIRLLFQVSATVFITIEDINDNTPIFQNTPYKTEISEVRMNKVVDQKFTKPSRYLPFFHTKRERVVIITIEVTTNKLSKV